MTDYPNHETYEFDLELDNIEGLYYLKWDFIEEHADADGCLDHGEVYNFVESIIDKYELYGVKKSDLDKIDCYYLAREWQDEYAEK